MLDRAPIECRPESASSTTQRAREELSNLIEKYLLGKPVQTRQSSPEMVCSGALATLTIGALCSTPLGMVLWAIGERRVGNAGKLN